VTRTRVAFFTDTFQEINGVALTGRQFTDFARRQQLPFLCIRGGPETRTTREGLVTHVELKRGPLAFALDHNLSYDAALWRHARRVETELRAFQPDIIHIVSPGDVSSIGAYLAWRLKVPLAISWHTNLHEFAAMRLERVLWWLPEIARRGTSRLSESETLRACLAFYRLGKVLFAPNPELVRMLGEGTGRPVFLMKRGIDAELFHPGRRTVNDGVLRLGYVGRITPEKSVRFLKKLESALQAAGAPPFRFLVVGDGADREWLAENLDCAEMPGIHRGEDLARDYANMDVFTFPSRTDTFGNVVLEAFASGVPAVVTDAGGPRFIVNDGVSGFVAGTETEFIERTARLLNDAALRSKMARAAREQALGESWDDVFRRVYEGYETVLPPNGTSGGSRVCADAPPDTVIAAFTCYSTGRIRLVTNHAWLSTPLPLAGWNE
jgi:glycosyltransferase involved in cell wall biosynthesis